MHHVNVVPYAEEYKTLDHALDRIMYLKSMYLFLRETSSSKEAQRYEDEIYDTECQLLGLIADLDNGDSQDVDKLFFKTENFGIVTKEIARNLSNNLLKFN